MSSSSSDSRHSALPHLADYKLAQSALFQLQRRSALWQIAREIVAGLHQTSALDFEPLGESDITNACQNKSGVQHDCTAEHTCEPIEGAGFDCGMVSSFECVSNYSNCEGQTGNTYECKTDFDCSTSGDGKNIVYSCQLFNCSGEEAGFDCNLSYDFLCNDDFACDNQHDCTSDHIFMCSDDFNCATSHSCKSDGTPTDCQSPHKYTATPVAPDPGDFMCGGIGNPNDTEDDFSCGVSFNCSAKDQFICAGPGTDFSCGTLGAGDFECKAAMFQCDEQGLGSDFSCDRYSAFTKT